MADRSQSIQIFGILKWLRTSFGPPTKFDTMMMLADNCCKNGDHSTAVKWMKMADRSDHQMTSTDQLKKCYIKACIFSELPHSLAIRNADAALNIAWQLNEVFQDVDGSKVPWIRDIKSVHFMHFTLYRAFHSIISCISQKGNQAEDRWSSEHSFNHFESTPRRKMRIC